MIGLFHIDANQLHLLTINESQGPMLILIYSGGYLSIFILFTLMYYHAWKKRNELKSYRQ